VREEGREGGREGGPKWNDGATTLVRERERIKQQAT
jgi:hypothetical protein